MMHVHMVDIFQQVHLIHLHVLAEKVCIPQILNTGLSGESFLSPNPLLMYSANAKDSENADR